MSTTTIASSSKFAFRYGNPAITCGSAEVHVQCRQLAVIMRVTGAICGSDSPADTGAGDGLDALCRRAAGSVIPEKAFVLDLTGVHDFAPRAVALLDTLDRACAAAGVEWSVVLSAPVAHTLHRHATDVDYPVAASVPEALHRIGDAVGERRRLLPLLTKSA